MSYCGKCGRKLEDSEERCPVCGAYNPDRRAPVSAAQFEDRPKDLNGTAIAAIILHWLPVVGLILGIAALAGAKKYRRDLKGLAIAALILSILWHIGYAVLLFAGLLPVLFALFMTGYGQLTEVF